MGNSADLLSILGCIFTGASALLIFFTYKLQRKHNRKSIEPLIHIGYGDFENKLIVNLKNVGLGTAIITNIRVYIDQRKSKNSLYDWLPETLPRGMDYKYYLSLYKNFAIRPGDSVKMVHIKLDPNNREHVESRESIRHTLHTVLFL